MPSSSRSWMSTCLTTPRRSNDRDPAVTSLAGHAAGSGIRGHGRRRDHPLDAVHRPQRGRGERARVDRAVRDQGAAGGQAPGAGPVHRPLTVCPRAAGARMPGCRMTWSSTGATGMSSRSPTTARTNRFPNTKPNYLPKPCAVRICLTKSRSNLIRNSKSVSISGFYLVSVIYAAA